MYAMVQHQISRMFTVKPSKNGCSVITNFVLPDGDNLVLDLVYNGNNYFVTDSGRLSNYYCDLKFDDVSIDNGRIVAIVDGSYGFAIIRVI